MATRHKYCTAKTQCNPKHKNRYTQFEQKAAVNHASYSIAEHQTFNTDIFDFSFLLFSDLLLTLTFPYRTTLDIHRAQYQTMHPVLYHTSVTNCFLPS